MIRFYIDNAIEYLEFNLFELTQEDFNVLYLCLAFQNISADIPGKIKDESLSQEDVITKKLYKDYSLFKRELFQNLLLLNPEFDQLELFKKSQKLLDRFLFLFFGEDSGLLPPNSVRMILEQWDKLRDLDEYVPLYDRFRKYFTYLNTGFKGKQFDVFAYNGGLFKPDEILDTIQIDDQLLYTHTLRLAEYDFESEVDVNILGHIFENSLNEIDEIKAQIAGESIDKSKTKRKKDGVFYTPKYITKYIVENTVGKLCTEKKAEIGIIDEDYFTDKKRQVRTKEMLLQKLKTYRAWLLQITIIDPACGSGAFLNEALNFLINEHKYLDELETKLLGGGFVFPNIENSILENNLFGVDLNEESVEIAKLSLWLRTAQPQRKLNDLNNNIKCGNSLIDDPEIAGNKAFNWEKEFPQVFEKGGFDVVIGNPPYVKEATNKLAFYGLHNHACYQGKMDLWYFFGWLGLEIAKKNDGIISYIAPNNWITNDGASNFRKKVLEESQIIDFIDFGDYKVFADAGIQTMIYVMRKLNANKAYRFSFSKINDKNLTPTDISNFLNKEISGKYKTYKTIFNLDKFKENIFSFTDNDSEKILEKILKKGNFYLNSTEIFSGIDIGQDFINAKSQLILGNNFKIGDGVFNLSLSEYESYNFIESEKSLLKPFYTTKEINRYFNNIKNNFWVIYTSSKFKNPNEIIPYPNLKLHLDKFQQIITSDNRPYGLHRTRNEDIFLGEKILSIRKCVKPSFSYVDFDSYVNRTFNIIKSNRINLKFLTVILNSKLITFWLLKKGKLQGDMFQVDINPLMSIPIVKSKINQQPFISKADQMLSLNKELQEINAKFQRTLLREFSIEKLSKKMENWYKLPFSNFLDEIKKQKIELTLSQKAEWEDYFLSEQQKATTLQTEIQKTDTEIDKMVYELYGLTDEEIKIVENS
ncbi:TaqI-like C-terminal specificity domain-containing protein [Chryseobacterium sp. RU37D]|uniref:Eco57I restriction-modification methylase domain-containing protein n=1 Tax=Chryseobacterium sp. RU37D TaxID=1907397 RepID=UPI000956ED65|nr:DNA methyltransferase [Chryseobacterium sp. RU37D]SIP91736.1 TaqI-like C-terminal specificity domain-containing protein [Chryseobacterium sp. RU37D]